MDNLCNNSKNNFASKLFKFLDLRFTGYETGHLNFCLSAKLNLFAFDKETVGLILMIIDVSVI